MTGRSDTAAKRGEKKDPMDASAKGKGPGLSYIVRGIEVETRGRCATYPCSKAGWRCLSCVERLEGCYKGIITHLEETHHGASKEFDYRSQQVEQMNRVIGVANEQIPLLQRTTAEATERARDAERERDALRLEVQDLQSKLALAGTETTANRLRDVELELKNTKEALVNKTHELTQQRLKAAESRKQQHLVAIDLTNYRKYIQKAREREKSYREDILTLTKRLHALGHEFSKKDDSSIELKTKIEQLTQVSNTAVMQQTEMQHQNEGLLDTIQELSHALENACATEQDLRVHTTQLQREVAAKEAEVVKLQGTVAFIRNETQTTKSILAQERVRRKRAEETAAVRETMFPRPNTRHARPRSASARVSPGSGAGGQREGFSP